MKKLWSLACMLATLMLMAGLMLSAAAPAALAGNNEPMKTVLQQESSGGGETPQLGITVTSPQDDGEIPLSDPVLHVEGRIDGADGLDGFEARIYSYALMTGGYEGVAVPGVDAGTVAEDGTFSFDVDLRQLGDDYLVPGNDIGQGYELELTAVSGSQTARATVVYYIVGSTGGGGGGGSAAAKAWLNINGCPYPGYSSSSARAPVTYQHPVEGETPGYVDVEVRVENAQFDGGIFKIMYPSDVVNSVSVWETLAGLTVEQYSLAQIGDSRWVQAAYRFSGNVSAGSEGVGLFTLRFYARAEGTFPLKLVAYDVYDGYLDVSTKGVMRASCGLKLTSGGSPVPWSPKEYNDELTLFTFTNGDNVAYFFDIYKGEPLTGGRILAKTGGDGSVNLVPVDDVFTDEFGGYFWNNYPGSPDYYVFNKDGYGDNYLWSRDTWHLVSHISPQMLPASPHFVAPTEADIHLEVARGGYGEPWGTDTAAITAELYDGNGNLVQAVPPKGPYCVRVDDDSMELIITHGLQLPAGEEFGMYNIYLYKNGALLGRVHLSVMANPPAAPLVKEAALADGEVVVFFTEPMLASTVNNSNIFLMVGSGQEVLRGDVSYVEEPDGTTPVYKATFKPWAPLESGASYTLTVSSEVQARWGAYLDMDPDTPGRQPYTWQFTVSEEDTTPPTVPQNLRVARTWTSITLGWDASTDDSGVIEYIIERKLPGGEYAEIGTSGEPQFSLDGYVDTWLPEACKKLYSFRVRAKDGAGNLSGWSGELEYFIFLNGNIYAVQNNPTNPTVFTIEHAYTITFIYDYHYFNYGAQPGTIGLVHEDGTEYGPWQTEGATGQGGVLNAYWYAMPNEQIKAGTYTVIDSDPSTWSHNQASNYCGFTYIEGYRIIDEAPGQGTVSGRVILQGRAPGNYGGVKVSVDTPSRCLAAVTDADGNFVLNGVPGGTQELKFAKEKYLIKKVVIQVVASDNLVGSITLLVGDINGDNAINLQDLAILARAYRSEAGQERYNPAADLNEDNRVNLQDLTLLASNFWQAGD